MELVGNLVDSLWQRGSAWLAPRAASRRRVEELCSRIDADVWQHVFSYLGPETADPQPQHRLAFPALSLDEVVQCKLSNNENSWSRSRGDQESTAAWLATINALRCVSTGWREVACYDRLVPHLSVHSNWLIRDTLPNDFAQRFRACASIGINGKGERDTVVWSGGYQNTMDRGRRGFGYLPEDLVQLGELRSLTLHSMKLYHLPRWFAGLRLVELWVSYPIDPYRPTERAWERDPNILPRTLEVLIFSADTSDVSLQCVRNLQHLRELDVGAWHHGSAYSVPYWFDELTSLRRFSMYCGTPTHWSRELRHLDLESLDFSVDRLGETYEEFDAALNNLFVQDNPNFLTACGTSLRELHLTGYEGLRHVPGALRRLTGLQHLCLDDSFDLEELPDWIGELPLVVLCLNGTQLRTLPTSLRGSTTLRILELGYTSWLSGPQRYNDKVIMIAGQEEIDLDEAADEIARIDGELRPLSLALPDLRLRLHDRHWDRGEEPPAGHWWHARCGHHWTEPVFY